MNHNFVTYQNRLKSLFLPDLVPIFVRSFSLRITDFDLWQAEVSDHLPHLVLVPGALLDVSQQATLGLGERLEPNLSQLGRQHIRSILAERPYLATHFKILHNIYNNV